MTANIALNEAGFSYIDVVRSWRLNERHYGALQGKEKAEILAQYGAEQFMTWRRSFDVSPPPIEENSIYQSNDKIYNNVDPSVLPKTESIKSVTDRMLPFYQDVITKELLQGKTVVIAAHGNSLRALVKHLDKVSDVGIADLNIPTGIPLIYDLDTSLKPIKPAYYLDPEAAASATVTAVSLQGK